MYAAVGGNTIWMAVPDIEFTSDPFLPGNVQDIMESGEFDTDVEIIIGTNADDGMLFILGPLLFPILFEEFKNSFNYSAPMALFDAHDSRLQVEFLRYVNNDDHRWKVLHWTSEWHT